MPKFYCRMPFLSQTVSSFALSNAWRNMVRLRARHYWAKPDITGQSPTSLGKARHHWAITMKDTIFSNTEYHTGNSHITNTTITNEIINQNLKINHTKV